MFGGRKKSVEKGSEGEDLESSELTPAAMWSNLLLYCLSTAVYTSVLPSIKREIYTAKVRNSRTFLSKLSADTLYFQV
jgi:hypothetical protein